MPFSACLVFEATIPVPKDEKAVLGPDKIFVNMVKVRTSHPDKSFSSTQGFGW